VKKSKSRRKTSSLPFFIPIAAAALFVLYLYLTSTASASGTLNVRAGTGTNNSTLTAQFTVNGVTGTTPENLTLGQGAYTITFSPLSFFETPTPYTVTIIPGSTTYAYGHYTPKGAFIAIRSTGFNVTQASVLHGVTPITWVNQSGQTETLASPLFPSSVQLLPGRTFTYVIRSAGTYSFALLGLSASLTVNAQ
jgi:hypothetical protein